MSKDVMTVNVKGIDVKIIKELSFLSKDKNPFGLIFIDPQELIKE
jgi:hypothetical protein